MSDSPRLLRTALLLSPLLLASCDTLDLASLDLPSITMPWDTAAPAPAAAPPAALREDVTETAAVPEGIQQDDWRAPFGGASTVALTDTSRTPRPR